MAGSATTRRRRRGGRATCVGVAQPRRRPWPSRCPSTAHVPTKSSPSGGVRGQPGRSFGTRLRSSLSVMVRVVTSNVPPFSISASSRSNRAVAAGLAASQASIRAWGRARGHRVERGGGERSTVVEQLVPHPEPGQRLPSGRERQGVHLLAQPVEPQPIAQGRLHRSHALCGLAGRHCDLDHVGSGHDHAEPRDLVGEPGRRALAHELRQLARRAGRRAACAGRAPVS